MKLWFGKWKRCRMSKRDSKTQIVRVWIFINKILHSHSPSLHLICFFSCLWSLAWIALILSLSRQYPSAWGIGVFAFKNVHNEYNYMTCTMECVEQNFCFFYLSLPFCSINLLWAYSFFIVVCACVFSFCCYCKCKCASVLVFY